MLRKIKNVDLKVLLILLSLLSITSCNEDSVNNISKNGKSNYLTSIVTYTENPYEQLGQEYNAVMSYFYNKIKTDTLVENYYTNRTAANEEISRVIYNGFQNSNYSNTKTYNEVLSEVNGTNLDLFLGKFLKNIFKIKSTIKSNYI